MTTQNIGSLHDAISEFDSTYLHKYKMERKLQILKLTDKRYAVNLLPMKSLFNNCKLCNTDSSKAYIPLLNIFIPCHF